MLLLIRLTELLRIQSFLYFPRVLEVSSGAEEQGSRALMGVWPLSTQAVGEGRRPDSLRTYKITDEGPAGSSSRPPAKEELSQSGSEKINLLPVHRKLPSQPSETSLCFSGRHSLVDADVGGGAGAARRQAFKDDRGIEPGQS